jgi:hypothetical protein
MNDLIAALAAVDPPNEPGYRRALGVPLAFECEETYFIVYRATLVEGPFSDALVRINKEDATGVVTLWPRAPMYREEIDPAPFGMLEDVEIAPRVPPEGEITFVYRLGKPHLRVSFMARSNALTRISLDWERDADPAS